MDYITLRSEQRRLGRLAATLIARQRAETPDGCGSLVPSYMSAKVGIASPFKEQLTWANRHPDIFEPLERHDVYPLDPTWLLGNVVTVVEAFQALYKQFSPVRSRHEEFSPYLSEIGSLDSLSRGVGIENVIRGQVRSEIDGKYGSKEFRGFSSGRSNVEQHRPELLPFLRPSGGQAEITESRYLGRRAATLENARQRTPNLLLRMRSPGCFTRRSFAHTILAASRQKHGFRISWLTFNCPLTAARHLLSGGECSAPARRFSLPALERQLKVMPPEDLEGLVLLSTTANGGYDKPFISASLVSNFPPPSPNMGNLKVEIASERLFKVPSTPSNFFEREIGLPLLLNPLEVRRAWLNFDTDREVELTFHFKQNHQKVRVELRDPALSTDELIFHWKSRDEGYVPMP